MDKGQIINPEDLGWCVSRFEPPKFVSYHEAGAKAWISVKDSLPDPYQRVLVSNSDEGVFRAYRDSDNDEFPSWQCSPQGSYAGDGCVFGITHWMPLPSPPDKPIKLLEK